MASKSPPYIRDIDRLIEDTPLPVVLQHYGQPLPRGSKGEHRMPCVFNEACNESSYGQLAVNQDSPAKLIHCHSCGTRGNLLTLLHGLENDRPPTGPKLRGDEFKQAAQKLRELASSDGAPPLPSSSVPSPAIAAVEPTSPPRNIPLRSHENENARKIADLYKDLCTDVAGMPPNAAAYFRERSAWLTPELAAKWRMGYIPKDGRSMFRNWIVYAHHDVAGNPICYSGRDPSFAEKWQKWLRQGSPSDKKPMKHKYVKGYERGLELYGQMAVRLEQDYVRRSLTELGLVVVEGANDTMRLDALEVAAVGLCSNRATEEQIEKITRFSREQANNRVVLLPDNDDEGQAGFQDLSWKLLERQIEVRLGWSSQTHDGQFAGMQPENVTPEQWKIVASSLT